MLFIPTILSWQHNYCIISDMSENKTVPTRARVDTFLLTISEQRRAEAKILINLMKHISSQNPVLWGPSIIGFGLQHYRYDSGREGDMPVLAFSPRKSAITIYFNEGFDRYSELLKSLGKHKTSISCLYVNKLKDIDIDTLNKMLKKSYKISTQVSTPASTTEEYIKGVPKPAKNHFSELRNLIRTNLPNAKEVLSYGVLGYKTDDKRAKIFIAGWKDHIGMYPLPKDASLQDQIKPYVKGKGTMWFKLDKPLPKELIIKITKSLTA